MSTFWSAETAATCSKTCSKVSSSSEGGTVMTVVTSEAVLLEGKPRGRQPRETRRCAMPRESRRATTRQRYHPSAAARNRWRRKHRRTRWDLQEIPLAPQASTQYAPRPCAGLRGDEGLPAGRSRASGNKRPH